MRHPASSGISSRVNRRTFLAGAVTAGAAAAFAGRFGTTAGQDRPEITIWLDSFNAGVTSQCMVDGVIAPYNATGSADVNATILANSWEAIRTALTGGDGPDVIATPGPPRALKLARAGQLLPLDEFTASERWSETFKPWALDLGVVDGKLYSLPFEVEAVVLYYNKTLFAQQGWAAPTTMTELMTLSQIIHDAGIIPFAHCNQEYRAANEWYVGEFINHVAGPQKVYQVLTGTAKFTDPEFVEAISTLTTMQQNGWFMGGLDRYYTTTFADANAAFAEGKAAMKIEGTWWLPNVAVFWGPDAGNNNDWDWVPVPSRNGEQEFTLGVATMAINATSRHPEEAARFLTYFYSPEAQATTLTDCQLAPAPVALPDDLLTRLDPRHAAILAGLNQASATNTFGFSTSTFWPPKTELHLIEEIEKVWAGDMTASDYLQGMQSLFDEELTAGDVPTIPAR